MKKLYAIIAIISLSLSSYAGLNDQALVAEINKYITHPVPGMQPMQYMPDGQTYAQLTPDGKQILTYDIKTGKQTGTLLDITHTRESQLESIQGFKLSPNAAYVLVWRNKQMRYRRSFTAEFYTYEVRTRLLRPLSNQFAQTQIPTFSPDSRMVAFVAENNIYLRKLDYNTEVSVTTDGRKDCIINGATDWTYEEEFTLTSSLAWAPDNSVLSYLKFNETDVHPYNMTLYQGTCNPREEYALYPGQYTYKYPVAGEKNSVVSVHSYDVETRKTKDITLPGGDIEYIPRLVYGPSPRQLMAVTLNRDQNIMQVISVNPMSTTAHSVYTMKSTAWILPQSYENIHWANNHFSTFNFSDKGNIQVQCISYTGSVVKTIAHPEHDITAYYGSDAQGNHYYQAAAPLPTQRTLYCLTAKGTAKALSPEKGTTNVEFSPDMAYRKTWYSDSETPTQCTLTTADGRTIRPLSQTKDYAAEIAGLHAKREFITIPSAKPGLQMNAFIVKPHDFNPSNRYPVIMYQYQGPGSQEVLDQWNLGWMDALAAQGFVVICADGRGTGARGADYLYTVYMNLGHYETLDQLAAARYAASLPYVDPQRIGLFGWSYGGYETLMAAQATGAPYAAAVAVAPVTSWRYYDTVYAERYMRTPQQNDKGYNQSAPITNCASLSCPLLIMHGTLDDNVHLENTLQYVSNLQSHNMFCDMFLFPNMNHSINGCNARGVVYGKMLKFFKQNLR